MKGSKITSISSIYIILWCVYELQVFVFGTDGTIFSRLIILFLLAVSVYYTVYAITRYKMTPYIKALSVLLLMFTIYGAIFIISQKSIYIGSNRIRNFSYLQGIYISLLPIFPFYVFTRKGMLRSDNVKKWAVWFVFIATLQFFQKQLLAQQQFNAEEVTNNMGYAVLSVIPLLSFFSSKRNMQYIGIVYLMALVIFSMKRGAILIGAICVAWFLYSSLKTSKRGRKATVVIIGVAVVLAGYYLVQYMLSSSDYFNIRVESTFEGDSSNRNFIYSRLWNHFINESNGFHFLLGNGACYTVLVAGNVAHNDWLEILINQGLIGAVIYLFYWLRFYQTTKRARYDDELYLAISLLLIINFSKGFISMSYGDMSIYSTFCLGYCLGRLSEKDNVLVNK